MSAKSIPKNIELIQIFSRVARSMLENTSISARYRKHLLKYNLPLVERIAESPLPIELKQEVILSKKQLQILKGARKNIQVAKTTQRTFEMYLYFDKTIGREHIVISKNLKNRIGVPIRIHSSCVTGESFHASNCDCHDQLELALRIIDKLGYGAIIWLYQEGRGNGLLAKIKQIKLLIENGLDTATAFEKAGFPRDQRDFTSAAHILKDLGIKSVRLITNNPDKIAQTESLGIKVNERIPCIVIPKNKLTQRDMKAKKIKLEHLI